MRQIIVLSLAFPAVTVGCGGEDKKAQGPSVGAPIVASQAAPPNEIDATFVSAARDQLWVATQQDGSVRRIDPEAQRLVGHAIFVTKDMVDLESSDEALWTIDQLHGRLAKIDARSGRVTFTRLGDAYLPDLSVTPDAVWVSSNNPSGGGARLTRVDPRTGEVTHRIELPFSTEEIEATRDTIWVANSQQRSVQRLDPKSGRKLGKPIQLGQLPRRLLASQGALWAVTVDPSSASERGELVRIDPGTGRATRIPIAAGVNAIVAGGGRLWLATRKEREERSDLGTVMSVEQSKAKPVGRPIRVGPYPGSLALAFGALWVADYVEHSVRRLSLNAEGSDEPPPPTPYQRRQPALLERINEASKTPPSTALGCERVTIEGTPRSYLGPPAPQITARHAGRAVEISYRFAHMPGADTCRPYQVLLSVGTWNEEDRVTGQEGSRTLMPPSGGGSASSAAASAKTITGLRSRAVTVRIR